MGGGFSAASPSHAGSAAIPGCAAPAPARERTQCSVGTQRGGPSFVPRREGDALRLQGSASNKGAPCRAPGWAVGRGGGAAAGKARLAGFRRARRPSREAAAPNAGPGGLLLEAARGTMAVGRAGAPDPPGRWTWRARRRRRRPGPSRPPWRPWSCGCPWWRGCWRDGHRGGGGEAQAAIPAGQGGKEPRPPQGTLRGEASPGGAASGASLARSDPRFSRCSLRANPRARFACTEPGAQKRRLIRLPHARGRSRPPESRPGEAARGGGLLSRLAGAGALQGAALASPGDPRRAGAPERPRRHVSGKKPVLAPVRLNMCRVRFCVSRSGVAFGKPRSV